MHKKTLCIIAAALLFTGCGTSTERAAKPPPTAVISPANPLAWVSVSFTEEGKQQYKANRKFSPDDLMRHVRWGLEEKSLLVFKEGQRFPELEIQIKEVRVRSVANAIAWGPLTGFDMVVAEVLIKSDADKIVDRYDVTAYYGHGGHLAGHDNARLGWLYENFTIEMLKELVPPASAPQQ